MVAENDVFHRADEAMRQVLNALVSERELMPTCPHPKNMRGFIETHDPSNRVMCAPCAFMDEVNTAIDYVCDVCRTPFRTTADNVVFSETPIDREYPGLPGFRGVLVVTVLTPCEFPECQAMAAAYVNRNVA